MISPLPSCPDLGFPFLVIRSPLYLGVKRSITVFLRWRFISLWFCFRRLAYEHDTTQNVGIIV